MSIVYLIRCVCEGQDCSEIVEDYVNSGQISSGRVKNGMMRFLKEQGWKTVKKDGYDDDTIWYCPNCSKFLKIGGD